jgi:hypothetical protein
MVVQFRKIRLKLGHTTELALRFLELFTLCGDQSKAIVAVGENPSEYFLLLGRAAHITTARSVSWFARS